MVDNAKDGGLDKAPGIKTKDPTTKETYILDQIAEDIGSITAYATEEYTLVYAKPAGVDIKNTGVVVESTGVGINTPWVQSAAQKEKLSNRVKLMNIA